LLKLQIPGENRMSVHKNPRLTPRARERIVEQVANGQMPEAVAETHVSALGPFANGLISSTLQP
jgi:hypothetical protein